MKCRHRSPQRERAAASQPPANVALALPAIARTPAGPGCAARPERWTRPEHRGQVKEQGGAGLAGEPGPASGPAEQDRADVANQPLAVRTPSSPLTLKRGG